MKSCQPMMGYDLSDRGCAGLGNVAYSQSILASSDRGGGRAMKSKIKTPVRPSRVQYAVLPWREFGEGRFEILLISSRETRRWVIPKGWPMRGLSPNFAAMREAYEEAGVEGYASLSAIGTYAYDKILANGRSQSVVVDVFALQVSEEHTEWPEMAEREKLWVAQGEAADLVAEPQLQTLIREFSPYG